MLVTTSYLKTGGQPAPETSSKPVSYIFQMMDDVQRNIESTVVTIF
jgi:hypothetical protein